MRVSSIERVAAAYVARPDLHRQVGEGQRLLGGVLGRHDAAQQRAQPGEQLLEGEGLGEVVVGPGVEALDPVADGVAGGEHEDGYVVPGGPQRARRLDPVESRHHHVHHDHVRVAGPEDGERLGAVGGQRDVVPVELQRAAQRVAHGAVVVDDEHAGLGEVSGTGLPCQSSLSLR